MVPLNPRAAAAILSWSDSFRRRVALNHAVIHGRPGLWGDHPDRPASAVLLREGDGVWEAIGAGRVDPALDWLVRLATPVALLAPRGWHEALAGRVGPVATGTVRTWLSYDLEPRLGRPPAERPRAPAARVLRLGPDDEAGFRASAPRWALRSWGSYEAMIAEGDAFGIPFEAGFAALAWILEQDDALASVGVWAHPRYRRLGLARAAASSLLRRIFERGTRLPVWFAAGENAASAALAASLGLGGGPDEPLSRWPAATRVDRPADAP